MNGNSIPPGYHPNDELWTQNTEVFEAIQDDFQAESDPHGPNRRKGSQASRYAIIGLSATIVVSLIAIGGLLLAGHGSWNAAPNAVTVGPSGPHVVLTPPSPTQSGVTTTSRAADSGYTYDTTTSSPSTTATPTTTTATAVAQAACDQLGQTSTASDGTILTCAVAGNTGNRWLPNTTPAVGSPCNTTEAGTFGYASNGTQLVCMRRAGSTTATYVWDNPGPVTSGKHEPGQICNLKKDVVAQSSSGRAVYCMPSTGANSNPYTGAWKYQS
ncbi:hypothetical protein GPX89_27320 [Nocardia sp. ET3-3]|uniref:Uncharacterized protein n=1 Tax=Nocardia terrae TaxID=2675851 RepID=A0A7K1V363_9NOCA|nr:hypothetical protein [Nocardia terrae]MVU80947.1 hypothetical protein [Nocardia terrae]